MAFAINLRFDLKRLSDDELAKRLEHAFVEREAIRPGVFGAWNNDSHRGPIRHPAVYAFLYLLYGVTDFHFFVFFLVPFLLSRRVRKWLLDSTDARIYLLNCEILDLHDEVARRVKARRG